MADNWNWNWNAFWTTDEETDALFDAIDRGDADAIRELIATNPKVMRWERGDGHRPINLYARATNPDTRVLDLLLEHETETYGQDPDPVSAACDVGSEVALRELLERGFSPDGRVRGRFMPPLHIAVERDRADLVRILLEAGADPGLENDDRRTALEFADKLSRTACRELLATARAGERVPFVNPRRPVGTVELDLVADEDAVRSVLTEACRAAQALRGNEELSAVAIHGSGYQGFVEVGCHTGAFDVLQPDCGAEVSHPRLARREFPEWRRAYNVNNRVVVHYGGKKPWSKTTRSTCETLDEPYFRFFKSILKQVVRAGELDALPLAAGCLFGVQTFLHHHCEFWDRRGRRVEFDRPRFAGEALTEG